MIKHKKDYKNLIDKLFLKYISDSLKRYFRKKALNLLKKWLTVLLHQNKN